MSPRTPASTYRLQLNHDFGFSDATRVVPYLHALGITHVYASPFLRARAGSSHGYDVVEHAALNPEIGDETAFDAWCAELRRHDMRLVLDIVPNHMGVGGDDNEWWLDVLEHGEASRFASYFDIDWRPANPDLQGRVLLPFLGDHYGRVLENGELKLQFNRESGGFALRYYEHLYPVDPRSYPRLLEPLLKADLTAQADRAELQAIIGELRTLPRRSESSDARRRQRQARAASCKRRVADLSRESAILEQIESTLERFNGEPGNPGSFDLLHQLLEAQAWRLSFWRVASDDINYRRFFDINDLAGLRTESAPVFQAIHTRIRQILQTGIADGLRVDHPDGLSDPVGYFENLAQLLAQEGGQSEPLIYVEKILARYERLPADWPVAGTTGYEVAWLLNSMFVHPAAEREFDRLWARLGDAEDFAELVYRSKKLIMLTTLAGELSVLANRASAIARADRRTRDFTYNSVRSALVEIIACFPVYRTYISGRQISDEDLHYIDWAIQTARRRGRAADQLVFDFLEGLLTRHTGVARRSRLHSELLQFAQRFQQVSAPVMAKGFEDTALYRYNRLVSMNDVGFDPDIFGISVAAFHRENEKRLQNWPRCMIGTSTHDSKRSEDVRVRLDVLTEIPREWRAAVLRWRRLNRSRKQLVADQRAPSSADEYLFYQTLLGIWKDGPVETVQQRVEDCMIKAVREAKLHSSWIDPDSDYENALKDFMRAVLSRSERNPFVTEFDEFASRLMRPAQLTGLSQTLLKLTVPGIPDFYQGTELTALNLVDPDNRRPVDFEKRCAMLCEIEALQAESHDQGMMLRQWCTRLEDDRARLRMIRQLLHLRREQPQLFIEGDYLAVETVGKRADHLVSFIRRHGEQQLLVCAPRWFLALGADERQPTELDWGDTQVLLPENCARQWRSVLGVGTHTAQPGGELLALDAAVLLADFPVAALLCE